MLLHRLSTFEDPAWDRTVVRETVDILVVLERLVDSFRVLQGMCVESTEAELFGKMAKVFEWVRNMSKSKLVGAEEGDKGCGNERVATVGEEFPDVGMPDLMGGVDDAWLNEMLGSWSYDFMSK